MHVVFLWLAQSHLFLCWSVVLALALPVPHTYWLELMLLATAQALAEVHANAFLSVVDCAVCCVGCLCWFSRGLPGDRERLTAWYPCGSGAGGSNILILHPKLGAEWLRGEEVPVVPPACVRTMRDVCKMSRI
eukprot:426896-Pelagomonas_calceolata.AAC.1